MTEIFRHRTSKARLTFGSSVIVTQRSVHHVRACGSPGPSISPVGEGAAPSLSACPSAGWGAEVVRHTTHHCGRMLSLSFLLLQLLLVSVLFFKQIIVIHRSRRTTRLPTAKSAWASCGLRAARAGSQHLGQDAASGSLTDCLLPLGL